MLALQVRRACRSANCAIVGTREPAPIARIFARREHGTMLAKPDANRLSTPSERYE
jgi:hypothetical protein